MDQFTIITGASGGLGKSFAVECAGRGMNLILTSLPDEGLPVYGQQIHQEFGVKVHVFEADLSDRTNIAEFVQWVKKNFEVNFLINNLGIGCSLPSFQTNISLIDRIIDLNVRPTAIITHELLPVLARQKESYILNVSSIIGMYPCPYKTIYPASKSFVYSYSRGLREELMDTSISVSVILPGPFASNAEVTEQMKNQRYVGRLSMVDPDEIARLSISKTLNRKPVIIPGRITRLFRVMMRLIPERIGLRILARVYRKDAFVAAAKKQSEPLSVTQYETGAGINKSI